MNTNEEAYRGLIEENQSHALDGLGTQAKDESGLPNKAL